MYRIVDSYLVNAITCEIIDPAPPKLVCGLFMDFNEITHIDSLRDSNMTVSNKFKRAYNAPGGALVPNDINQSIRCIEN